MKFPLLLLHSLMHQDKQGHQMILLNLALYTAYRDQNGFHGGLAFELMLKSFIFYHKLLWSVSFAVTLRCSSL